MKQNDDMDILNDKARLKDNPFVVPDGYFEAMRERALRVPEIQETRSRKIRRILVPVFSVAASIALVFSECCFLTAGGRHRKTISTRTTPQHLSAAMKLLSI